MARILLKAIVHYTLLAAASGTLTHLGIRAYNKYAPDTFPSLVWPLKGGPASPTEPAPWQANVRSAKPEPDTATAAKPRQERPAVQATHTGYWGVVKIEQGKTYTTKGKQLSSLPLGTPVSIPRTVSGKSGELAVCKPVDNTDQPDGFVMKANDLLIRPGTYANATPHEKELVRRRAELEGRLAQTRRSAQDAAAAKNPYHADYQRVQAAYEAFWNKVRDLQARRDRTSGATHMEYSDQLRMMKGQDIELAREMAAIKARFDEWNSQHPADPGEDPRIALLVTEIAGIDARLRAMETHQ